MNDPQNIPPQHKDPSTRILAMPTDTNPSGDIFGGWIMSQVDIAGAVEARKVVKCKVVTVAVNSFLFKQPVYVGDLISCYGTVVKTGRTSITVQVEVFADRRCTMGEVIKVTSATIVYVAVDENGAPRQLDIGATGKEG